MSYDIFIYHRDANLDFEDDGNEEGEHPPLGAERVGRFLVRLAKYGYSLENQTPEVQQFVKDVGGCPIQVNVSEREIAFTVPYWENAKEAIFEALQDSAELLDDIEEWKINNPQEE